jgi:ribonuclease HI
LGKRDGQGEITVRTEKNPEASLFPEKKSAPPPAEESILSHLAQTLSVAKTLKRFPTVKPKDLQEILERCLQLLVKGKAERPSTLPPKRKMEFSIHTDGASRGNPGEAGIGVVIADEQGKTVKELKSYLGMTTNNVAEYRAVLLALEKAFELGAESVIISLDSELVVRQITGEYKVREAHLKPLHRQVLDLLHKFTKYRILHIPREENRRADQLANEAIDQRVQGA